MGFGKKKVPQADPSATAQPDAKPTKVRRQFTMPFGMTAVAYFLVAVFAICAASIPLTLVTGNSQLTTGAVYATFAAGALAVLSSLVGVVTGN
jgi:hypothetical protein